VIPASSSGSSSTAPTPPTPTDDTSGAYEIDTILQ